MREINLQNEKLKIIAFIKEQLSQAGMKDLVVGISGGIDSAVTAALCVEAAGKEKVHAFLLPYRLSHPDSLAHGKLVAEHLGLDYEVIDISPMVEVYFNTYAREADYLRKGNRMARERMCILFDQSARYKALVAGTGNKSELLTGYVTQHGDGACAFEPLGHLYKTEIFKMAEYLGLPEIVINKKPTADLWAEQTDEAEMGLTYTLLDEILYGLYDRKMNEQQLQALGCSKNDISRVKQLYQYSEFKRHLPPQPQEEQH
ncbi:MAG: NAD+ synthase [Candidatus Cloacimonetes bacterium]|nr:NAD+ synthase [Candidatus Cloacimonadota bacterium]